MFSDIKTLKAIANRTMFGGAKSGSKMQAPSVGAQFQVSRLHDMRVRVQYRRSSVSDSKARCPGDSIPTGTRAQLFKTLLA